MKPASVRLPVPSADLTDLVRVRGDTIEALADRGAFFGEVYPAISTDDGADWRLDGPQFDRAAADGANATDRLAVTTNGTLAAWGRTGSIVKTRAYGSSRWRASGFDEGLRSLHVAGSRLIVSTYPITDPPQPVTTYVSRDNGWSWRPAARP